MKGLRGRPILALNLVTILTFLFVTWPVGLTAARETPADNTHLSALPAWAVLPTAPATHRAESLPVPVKSPTGPRPL